ncbi:hypothetical protein FDECE_11865 [Fusarium decemcellulare]|nr:hypothetical protein FDECE_11865 [Fusarium decemcellulare]
MHFLLLTLFSPVFGVLASPFDQDLTSRNAPKSPYPGHPINETATDIVLRAFNPKAVDPHALNSRSSGGFLGSCKDIRFYLGDKDMDRKGPADIHDGYLESPVLVAHCPDLAGEMRCTSLQLSTCMQNKDGNLVAGLDGQWQGSCTQCIMREDGRHFWCRCWSFKDGQRVLGETVINLIREDTIVQNFDGDLMCSGQRGLRGVCPDEKSFDVTEYGWGDFWLDLGWI